MAIQNSEETTEDKTVDENTSIVMSDDNLKKSSTGMKNPFGPYSYVVLAVLFLIRLCD